MWDLSSQTRDWTHVPCKAKNVVLTTRVPGKSLHILFFLIFFHYRLLQDIEFPVIYRRSLFILYTVSVYKQSIWLKFPGVYKQILYINLCSPAPGNFNHTLLDFVSYLVFPAFTWDFFLLIFFLRIIKKKFFFFYISRNSFITEILLVVLRITTQTFQSVHISSHTYLKSKRSCSCDS